MRHRFVAVAALSVAGLALGTAQANAHECVNASKKNQASGVQVVIDINTGDVVWTTKGLANRIDQGLVDPVSGEGFHGLVGLDFNGDGAVDVATWMVGPNDEIPDPAQWNGATCRGVVNIETFLTECQTTPV
jgi:hypothetical protein